MKQNKKLKNNQKQKNQQKTISPETLTEITSSCWASSDFQMTNFIKLNKNLKKKILILIFDSNYQF